MSLFDDASLVLIPDGAKDGTLYSVKPTDGTGDFTFTRGSNLAATRVDENGLIEKGRENLLVQSNQFDTAWGASVTITSGESGYDGTNDAWLMTTAVAGDFVAQSLSDAGVLTFSIYAKAGSVNGIRLRMDAAVDANAYFNLTNGGSVYATSGDIDSKLVSVGNGWYRVSVTANISSVVKMAIYTTDGTTSYDNGTIYIQDAQLEAGLVATDYIETGATTAQAGILEDMPRLDYSGGTCPALLLEPQRTNLLAHSEYFGGYTNVNSTNEVNTTTSSEGLVNATSFLEAATTGQHKLTTSYSFDGSSTYTFSIFAKSNGRDLYIDTQNSNEWGGRAWFDLTNGTANSVLGSASIQDVGNGWYRCIVTGASTLAGGNFIELLTSDGSINSTTGDTTKGVYIYGAQLEAGSYPTSYIPTYGTSVTRGLDACTNSTGGVSQTEGTIFIDYKDSPNKDVLFACSTSAALITNNIRLSHNQLYIRNSTGNLVVGSVTLPDEGKLAIKYDTNGVKIFSNGNSTPIFTNSTSIFLDGSVDFVRIGSRVNNLNIEEFNVDQFLIFTTALSDAECVTLTT